MVSRRRQQKALQQAFIALDLKQQHEARMRRARIIDRRAEADRMLEEKAKTARAQAARAHAVGMARTQPVAPQPEYKPQSKAEGEGEQPDEHP